MSSDNSTPHHEPNLTPLEQRLGSWVPDPATGRDRMLFEAGRASALSSSSGVPLRIWQGLAALLLVASLASLAGWLQSRSAHQRALHQIALLESRSGKTPIQVASASQPVAAEPGRDTGPLMQTRFDPNSYLLLTRTSLGSDARQVSLPADQPSSAQSQGSRQNLRAGDRFRYADL